MRLHRTDLAVRHAASKDDTRQNLCGVRLEGGRTVATDGHMLATVRSSDATAEALEPCTLQEGKPFQAVAKAAASEGVELVVHKTNGNGQALFRTPDADLRVPKIDGGEYPNWRQLLFEGTNRPQLGAAVVLDARLLERVAKIALEHAEERRKASVPVLVALPAGPNAYASFHAHNDVQGSQLTVIVMPLRLRDGFSLDEELQPQEGGS